MESKGGVSGSRPIVCPLCEVEEMRIVRPNIARCDPCEYSMGAELIGTLRQMATLPESAGSHACECGYPEMRLLPDGIYLCPSCRAEVTPAGSPEVEWKTEDHPEAYWQGWLDGRYSIAEEFQRSSRLARWENANDRLEYYRGHRAGGCERQKASARR